MSAFELIKAFEEIHRHLEEAFGPLPGKKLTVEEEFDRFADEMMNKGNRHVKSAASPDIAELANEVNRLYVENGQLKSELNELKDAYEQMRSAAHRRGKQLSSLEESIQSELRSVMDENVRLQKTVDELRDNNSDLVQAINQVTKERDELRLQLKKMHEFFQDFNSIDWNEFVQVVEAYRNSFDEIKDFFEYIEELARALDSKKDNGGFDG